MYTYFCLVVAPTPSVSPIVPPSTTTTASNDPSLCRLPGCNQPKYREGDYLHDFCSKTHAQEAKKKGIEVLPGILSSVHVLFICWF